jgi:hypothetical protein
VGALGGVVSFGVRAPAGCAWTAEARDPWIALTLGASGSGDGDVAALVSPSLDPAERTGTIVAGQQTFTIRQAPLLPPDDDTVELEGRIDKVRESCPDRRFDLEKRTVHTSQATEFTNGDCEALEKRTRVRVRGRERQDNDIDAIQVVFENER